VFFREHRVSEEIGAHKKRKRGEVVVSNRQFPGAMATADWYNRWLMHRETRRGDEQRERGDARGG